VRLTSFERLEAVAVLSINTSHQRGASGEPRVETALAVFPRAMNKTAEAVNGVRVGILAPR
jgi:hypothetical protein